VSVLPSVVVAERPGRSERLCEPKKLGDLQRESHGDPLDVSRLTLRVPSLDVAEVSPVDPARSAKLLLRQPKRLAPVPDGGPELLADVLPGRHTHCGQARVCRL